jgi:hypothetical protein
LNGTGLVQSGELQATALGVTVELQAVGMERMVVRNCAVWRKAWCAIVRFKQKRSAELEVLRKSVVQNSPENASGAPWRPEIGIKVARV